MNIISVSNGQATTTSLATAETGGRGTNNTIDMTTTRGCVAFVIDRRLACRHIDQLLEVVHDANTRDKRQARKFRETKNPILMRRAETLETEAKRRFDAMQSGRDLLLKYGQELMECAHLIDASVPQSLLLDLLNVNRADRIKVAPDDGITSIAFVNGLEDSAMYRGCGWKQGPLAQATIRFMNHELIHNQQLQRTANEHLFGKGGMFEFLPTYRETGSGGMVRMPPKLRLADECDAKINAAG